MQLIIRDYWVLLAIIPAIAAIAWLMRRTFIKFRDKADEEEYKKEKRGIRIFMFITRSLIAILLIAALASPFTIKKVVMPGDSSLTILKDNSTSMSIFNSTEIEALERELKNELPVKVRQIAFGETSAIGDALLNNIQGNDNLLIISDGNNNRGRKLGDMIVFASTLNTTINALRIQPANSDAAVTIEGQSEALVDTESDFEVNVDAAGKVEEYTLRVWVDNEQKIERKAAKSISIPLSLTLAEGWHRIKAEIDSEDFFRQNNVFYKTLNVLPKPNVLFLTKRANAPLWTIVGKSYKGSVLEQLPDDLSSYHAIVVNDLSYEELKDSIPRLQKYVEEGNGLVVVGGKNSYDRGGYKESDLEQLLPVKVGYGTMQEGSRLNVVLVIDISLSTGVAFGEYKKVDVEKSIAVGILDSLRGTDNVGVIAFNWDAYVVSELSTVASKPYLNRTIKRLTYVGGTRIFTGLQKALAMLRGKEGSRNIVLISDGQHADTRADSHTISYAKEIADDGAKLYTVGVGKDTNEELMRQLADTGKGAYYKVNEYDRLEIVFGRSRGNDTKANQLVVVEPNHFITKKINLSAYVAGYNFVLPKGAAKLLVSTAENNPIITAWRYGLGRVVSLSTDDGAAWSGEMLNRANSKIITRTINYAAGDLERKRDFYVKAEDTRINEEANIMVVSKAMPSYQDYNFTKTEENMYRTTFKPSQEGFQEFMGAAIAVNYPKEYSPVGMNPEMDEMVALTGGKTFGLNQTKELIEKIRMDSKRERTEPVYWRWPLAAAAIAIFLIEIFVRMVKRKQE